MTPSDDDLVHGSFSSAAFRSKLTLLEATLDEEIVALVVSRGERRQIAVKRQAVPVRVFLMLAGTVFERIALTQSCALATCVPEGRKRTSGLAARYPATSMRFFCMFLLLIRELKFFQETLYRVGLPIPGILGLGLADDVSRSVTWLLR